MCNTCNLVEIGGGKEAAFRRNIIIDYKDLKERIKMFEGKDSYATVYRYDSPKQDTANLLAPLYIDMDIDDIENNFEVLKRDLALVIRQLRILLKLKESEIEIYFSGSKGFHLIVNERVLGIEPDKKLNEKYKLIAVKLKTYTITKCIDTRIYDKKRLFRIENTINTKTGLYKIPVKYNQIKEMNYDELRALASSPKTIIKLSKQVNKESNIAFDSLIAGLEEENKRTINFKVARDFMKNKELLPCVKYILQNGANKGGRNNITMALASSLFQIGKEYKEVIEIVDAWNSNKNDPPLDIKEIEATVKSAYSNVNDNRCYGCNSFRELDVCVKGCPVFK